jgi:hypothetical protein
MSERPQSVKPWDTKRFAFYGAVLGVLVSIVHGYDHAFWRPYYEGDLLTHVLNQMVLFITSGTVGLAAVAAIRNWLRRKP